jgi:prepilin-type N-terminal cleavage/methylation domain-containing protein
VNHRDEKRQRGFTLLETMVALGVFAIVTLGVVPLLGSALKGSALARSQTVAQQAGRNMMERIEGTKWFTSYDAKPNKRVDILDLYFPQATNTGTLPGQTFTSGAANAPVTGTGGLFTTICPPPSGTNPACPTDMPTGYTMTIKAAFVKKVTTTTPETYSMVAPCTGVSTPTASCTGAYSWNTQAKDAPPADLMDVNVVMSWTLNGTPHSFQLRTIIGDRRFSAPLAADVGPTPTASTAPPGSATIKMRGNANIDYVMQVSTGFSSTAAGTGCATPPCKSQLTMTMGESESRIQTSDTSSTADQTTTTGETRIVRTYPAAQAPPPTPPPDLLSVTKSSTTLHAPPTQTLATSSTDSASATINHPDLANANEAFIQGGDNRNLIVDAGTSNELPQAQGYFQTWGTTDGATESYIKNSQWDFTTYKMAVGQPIVFLQRFASVNPDHQLGSYTKVNTTALNSASRYVQSTAHAGFAFAQWLRLQMSTQGQGIAWNMLQVVGFFADVNCKATANPATASATASWYAGISYYYDPTNNGSISNPPTSGNITLNSSGNDVYNGVSVANALDSLQAANPLEFDGTSVCCSATSDIYMFEERDPVTGNMTKRGYLTDVAELKNPPTTISADGRSVTADLNGAIRIDTAPMNVNATNPALAAPFPEYAATISFGNLSCEAVDNR